MGGKIFPIQTASACPLKWSWSTLYFDTGTTSSCHRVERSSIDVNDFDNFHNVGSKINDRKLMLEGKWPNNNCQYCKRIEDAGGISDRLAQLASPGIYPPELTSDPHAVNVTPTILEIYFKNTCNMACVYCNSFYSSKWEDENKKFKDSVPPASMYKYQIRNAGNNPRYDQMVSDLWRYLIKDDHYKLLTRYCVLGGEPFLLSELDDSIEFWEQHPNHNLTFDITSNLNIPHKRFREYINKMEMLVKEAKIGKFLLIASLDCWGTEQEYVRHGLDLSTWQENFEYAVDQPWLTLSINSTISALTIKHMKQLIVNINQWNTLRTNPIEWSFCTTDTQDSPYIFGPGVFDVELNDVLADLPITTDQQISARKQFEGVISAIGQSKKNPRAIEELRSYLNEVDRRRGTDWKKLFVWLDQLN